MNKSFVHCTSSLRTFFDSNALWLSMIIGALGYRVFLPLKPTLPWLIFFMLFFTFCKVNPLDLRLHRWHWVVLATQLVLSFLTYTLVLYFTGNPILAQGLLMCFIMPTATAAPIIAGKMGGSIQNLTTFTLLSNFATAIIVPATFPLINNNLELLTLNSPYLQIVPSGKELSTFFWPAFLLILSRIAPLLLGPFFSAWLLRLAFNYYYRRQYLSAQRSYSANDLTAQQSYSASDLTAKRSYSASGPIAEGGQKEFALPTSLAQIPFYLWVASIVVLSAVVTRTVVENIHYSLFIILWLLVASFFACLIQFALGKLIGYLLPAPSKGTDYQDVLINPAAAPTTMAGVSSITAGQAFGQKNTSLGVWMAQTYLSPMAALGAAAYIIWQNIFNSVQLFVVAHKH